MRGCEVWRAGLEARWASGGCYGGAWERRVEQRHEVASPAPAPHPSLPRLRTCPDPPQELAAAVPDHQLLAEYLDAIRVLTDAVHDDRRTKADLIRMSDRVLQAQEVGARPLAAAPSLGDGREEMWWCGC